MVPGPPLPRERGAISRHALRLLAGDPGPVPRLALRRAAVDDDDLHLALALLYELHHHGFAGVPAELEWDPAVLGFRGLLEARFVEGLGEVVAPIQAVHPVEVATAIDAAIQRRGGPSLSTWVEEQGRLRHLQELAVHRSVYQLKEADPHTWVIPRIRSGMAKSALLTLQFDEYGNGLPGRTHAELFVDTMRSLGLDPAYGRYLEQVPGATLATVNLLSLFGLHRRWRGTCIGHLAVFEMTSVVPMTRYARAHRRITGSDRGAQFYDVHVVADAHHEEIARTRLIPGLLTDEPELAGDVLFGAAALLTLERSFAEHVLSRWTSGRSALVAPAPVATLDRRPHPVRTTPA